MHACRSTLEDPTFSAWGHTTVDVGAPGEQILTTANGGGYRLIDGTSFSGPYTAGVVALVASANQFLSPVQLKAAILNSVDVVPALQGLVVSNGRVNAFKALVGAQFPGPVVASITPGPQTAPVSDIHVTFSKDLVHSFFDAANANPGGLANSVVLRRANGDSRFDGNDTFLNLNDPGVATVTLTARDLTIHLTAPLSRDNYRITLRAGSFRDSGGLLLNGDTTTGNDEVYDFNVVAFRGPYEPNDAISQATPIALDTSGAATVPDINIGDGLYVTNDVDIFRIFASGPALITAQVNARGLAVPSTLDSYLRLFDSGGIQLASNDNFNGLDSKIQFFVPTAGLYYVGVSGFPNKNYNALQENSGIGTTAGGMYDLFVQVQPNATDSTSGDNTTGINIPDTGIITSTINFTDGRAILDVNVRVNIAHTFVGDLRISLIGPSGQSVTLVNRRGGAGDNFTNTLFDDEAPRTVISGSPPYSLSGGYQPETSLTAFDQSTSAGTWTLRIEDLKAGDSGRLINWGLDLTLANDVFGPFEVNDTSILATATNIDGSGTATFNAYLGDGAFGLRDVDLFRFIAGAGTTITAVATPTSGTLDTVLRLFGADGIEIAADKRRGSTTSAITYVVANAGTYYLGVSGGNTTDPNNEGNTDYRIDVGGSGTQATDATGSYTLSLNVAGGISEGALLLSGNQIKVGVNTNGSIGYSSSPPSGSANTGLQLGNLDFLLNSGGLLSYFGGSVDGFNILNTADGSETDLSVAVANESDFGNRRATVTGTFRNLGVRRTLSFGANDRFIAVDVTLTNRSQTSINSLAWMEGFNPDQGFDGTTQLSKNTINNVRESNPRLATATVASGHTFGLGAADSALPGNVSVGFAPRGTIRDPFQIINGDDTTNDPDPTGDTGVAGDLDMAVTFNVGTLGPSQHASFRYFIFVDTTLSGVLANYNAMNNGTGGGVLTADAKLPANDTEGFANLPYRVYYPEGYANDRVQTYLPLVNANSEDVRVLVIARYERTIVNGVSTLYPPDVLYDSASDLLSGQTVSSTRFPANYRGGITLTTPALYAAGDASRVFNDAVIQTSGLHRGGVRKNVPYAVEVRASAPVGAILSHYDRDIATGEAFTSNLNSQWLLGTGQKGPGINDYITFYNPSDSSVKVTVTAFPATGAATGISIIQTLQPHRRGGWSVADVTDWPAGSLSFKIDADAPIVSALSHYDYNTHQGFGTLAQAGGGSTAGATGQGLFGVGAVGETISVVNPNITAASVTFTFSFANGSSYRYTSNVGAQRRGGFDVNNLVGFPVGQSYAVSYTSTQPVGVNVSSRTSTDQEGSVFSATANTQWLFAEGFRAHTLSDVQDKIRLYNPSALPTTVELVMNYNTGESEVFRRTLPARSGIEIDTHDLLTGARAAQIAPESFFGVRVQSSVPIIAWTTHFANYLGGGFGSLGTPLGSSIVIT